MIQRIWVLFLFLGCVAGHAQKAFPVQSKHSSTKEVVDIMVTQKDGTMKPLSDILTPDKNYIVSIMASWCSPCRTELNAFQKVAEEWAKDLNTEIIAISVEKPSDTHKLFALADKQKWTMQVVHDKMAYTSRELEVFGIPQTFLVNQKGDITYTTEGYSAQLIANYKKEIKKLF